MLRPNISSRDGLSRPLGTKVFQLTRVFSIWCKASFLNRASPFVWTPPETKEMVWVKRWCLADHSLWPAIGPHGLTTLAHCGRGCGVCLMEHSKHGGTGTSIQFPACLGIYLLILWSHPIFITPAWDISIIVLPRIPK